jgi:hypothetical protein
MPGVLLNYALFQLGWFACVLGAAHGLPLAGPLAIAGAVAVHLALAARPGREVRLLALCALAGGAFDSILLASGWVAYPNGAWIPGVAPYWIVAMWILFATTLNRSLGWLRGRPGLAALLGFAGAPLSYFGGAGLGAMTLVEPLAALTVLAVGWALLMPAMAQLATRLDGFSAVGGPAWIRSCWREAQVPEHG